MSGAHHHQVLQPAPLLGQHAGSDAAQLVQVLPSVLAAVGVAGQRDSQR